MRATDFGPVTGVPTAVPAFVGYTEKAESDGEPAFLRPVEIPSLADFESIFGGAGSAAFYLYDSLRLFFANGGGAAYVVSVGDFCAEPRLEDLRQGLGILESQPGPTLLAVPDAVLLSREEHATFLRDVLAHCARRRDRFAILDVQGGDDEDLDEDEVRQLLADFRGDLGGPRDDEESFGAAYFPFLLAATSSGEEIAVPASGTVAGVISRIDGARGVWHSPANVALTGVTLPAVRIDDRQQDDFTTAPEGKAVNLIRNFAGRGTRIWGARTLGSDPYYRYIQIRRTIIYIEQSIKKWLDQLAGAANDDTTRRAVESSVADFLHGLWIQGGLQGATPVQAYRVTTTTTQEDVDNGIVNVQIQVAPLRPAEFVVIIIQQLLAGRHPPP
ncbi:MAG TPA: phage tail sheath C-terminal domain-containing protein [Thermoanaerobaculia bacterium]